MLIPVQPEEHDAFAALLAAAFEEYAVGLGRPSAGPYPWLANTIASGACFWVEDHEAGLVGSQVGTVFEIDMLAVHPKLQGTGRGHAALAHIEAHARQIECQTLQLMTAQKYTRLVAFYSRHDFRVLSVGPHPRGRDDHLRVTLTKSLI